MPSIRITFHYNCYKECKNTTIPFIHLFEGINILHVNQDMTRFLEIVHYNHT